MFFRNCRKSAQDVSMNEPIDTDKDGNALVLMDVMAVEDLIVEELDTKMQAEKMYRYIEEFLSEREKNHCKAEIRPRRESTTNSARSRQKAGHIALLRF